MTTAFANSTLDYSNAILAPAVYELTINAACNWVTIIVPDWMNVEATGLALPPHESVSGLPTLRINARRLMARIIVRRPA